MRVRLGLEQLGARDVPSSVPVIHCGVLEIPVQNGVENNIDVSPGTSGKTNVTVDGHVYVFSNNQFSVVELEGGCTNPQTTIYFGEAIAKPVIAEGGHGANYFFSQDGNVNFCGDGVNNFYVDHGSSVLSGDGTNNFFAGGNTLIYATGTNTITLAGRTSIAFVGGATVADLGSGNSTVFVLYGDATLTGNGRGIVVAGEGADVDAGGLGTRYCVIEL